MSETQDSLVILLSTYNGARFIGDQIESIREQSFASWSLLIRDDGSTDETVQVLDALAAAEPRIGLLRDERGNLGPAQSFGALMEAALEAGAGYVAFADQDDVWHADKLEHQMEMLRARAAAAGRAVPLLVHSDLSVVDEQLHVIHDSFLRFQGLEHDREAALAALLTQNFVTGCTTVINRALLRVALPLPNVVMHDWWLALCAAALGEILYYPGATVLYRQHSRNAVGGRGVMHGGLDAAIHPVRWWKKSLSAFSASVRQAFALTRRVERESRTTPPSARTLATLRDYCGAFSDGTGALQRLRVVRRYGLRPRSLLGYPFLFYIRVVLWPAGGLEPCGARG